ncbi:membrane protein [Streptococcus pneumoniae]|nr:membrane protein [Streptococcus pneumoniae]CWL20607.1 membrane protein [Streptococcus pneumoniae]
MIKLWRRYKPFINAGVQELITYRVNFILYRIGDVMGAFVAFYLWKAVFDSSQESLIQGFSMADITLYIIMSFVTNLLTRSDSSFMRLFVNCSGLKSAKLEKGQNSSFLF